MGAYQRPAPDLGFYAVAEKTEGCEQLVEMVPATVLCQAWCQALYRHPLTSHNALQSSWSPHPALFLGGGNGGSEG